MKLATREGIRRIDSVAIEDYGISGLVLMENAGRASARIIRTRYPRARRVAVFAGAGNNGGDGFVIARHLISAGLEVRTLCAADPSGLGGDSLVNYEILRKLGADIVELDGKLPAPLDVDVAVDALFGTGLTRALEDPYRDLVEHINSLDAVRVAIDLPSGLEADGGQPLGTTTRADITITFILPKIGLFVEPGRSHAGRVFVIDITTPRVLEDEIEDELITFDYLRKFFGRRRTDTHKGTYGHLFVLAGSPGKSGAAVLAARGAARAGAGLITIGVPAGMNTVFERESIEPMSAPLLDTPEGFLGPEAAVQALEILRNRRTALVIGPGISTSDPTKVFFEEVVSQSPVPVLIDADGINILSERLDILKSVKSPCVLTPHPGEMAKLTGITNAEVQAARVEVTREFSREHGVYLVLKGAGTIVGTPEGSVLVNPTGNPGMASGGMGDVLSGIIGGVMAQGYSQLEACALGVFSHGLAGDLYAEENGEAGLMAGDVVDMLPRAFEEVISTGSDKRFFSTI